MLKPEPMFDYRGTYDENLPLPERLTLAQYSRVFFRPDAHFVEGHILPMHLGDLAHSIMQGELAGQIGPQADALGAACCISLRLRTSPTRIRVCDFVVLKPGAPREQAPSHPPLLCIETLSEAETMAETEAVLADYLAMGVENIWLTDPLRRSAHTFDTNGLHHADPTNLTVPGTGIKLDLTDSFAELD